MFSSPRKEHAPPDAEAVMALVIILKCLFVKHLASPPVEYLAECKKRWTVDEWNKFLYGEQSRNEQLIERLRRAGLWTAMDQKERGFMEAQSINLTQQAHVDVSWSVESIICLLWALGYLLEFPRYDEQVDPDLINKLPAEPPEILMKTAVLKQHELIERQRDVAELWHWRSRTRQLQEKGHKFVLPGNWTIEEIIRTAATRAAENGIIPAPIGDDFPAFGKAYRDLTHQEYSQATSIAMERHRAFNWLCGFAPDNRWEETPTDT